MKVVDPTELMKGFRRVDLSTADSVSLRGILDDIRRVRARFDHVEAEVAKRLKETSGTPERDVSKSAQRSNRHGHKVMARAAAIENEPTMSRALEAGDLGGEHVDVFAKVLGSLDGPVKEGFAEAAPALIEAAANSGSTPEEFAASLNATAEAIASDGGMRRLERQRRNTRLRTWTDRATGRWHLSGAFDPESGVTLHGRLEATMSAMFATKTPSTAPTHPGDKQDHLRALALLALTNSGLPSSASSPFAADADQSDEWSSFGVALGSMLGSGGKRFGKPEITLLLDTANLGPDGRPTADWGIPVTIPWERIKRLRHAARVRPVVIHEGKVIDADGELNLGRTSRLANRAQRACASRGLRHVRRARLQRVVQPHQAPPRALVAPWRPHRFRQSPPVVQPAPPPRPRGRLALHPRTKSRTHHRTPRRARDAHWPVQSSCGGVGVATL